jgi:hypothetical protein
MTDPRATEFWQMILRDLARAGGIFTMSVRTVRSVDADGNIVVDSPFEDDADPSDDSEPLSRLWSCNPNIVAGDDVIIGSIIGIGEESVEVEHIVLDKVAYESTHSSWTTVAVEDHAASHYDGGGDELTGNLNAKARIGVYDGGSLVGTRRNLNIIEGGAINTVSSDDAGGERVDVTISVDLGTGSTQAAAGDHGHIASAISDFSTAVQAIAYTEAEVNSLLSGKSTVGHGHVASDVSDFSEATDDRVKDLIIAGNGIDKTYDDVANTLLIEWDESILAEGTGIELLFTDPNGPLTITNTNPGHTDEEVRTIIDGHLAEGDNIVFTTHPISGDLEINAIASTYFNKAWQAAPGPGLIDVTSVTTKASGVTGARLLGQIPPGADGCVVEIRVTTALSGATWAEVGVAYSTSPTGGGLLLPSGAGGGPVSVTGSHNGTGIKSHTFTDLLVLEGYYLYFLFGQLGGTQSQYRATLRDEPATGYTRTATVRPTGMSAVAGFETTFSSSSIQDYAIGVNFRWT